MKTKRRKFLTAAAGILFLSIGSLIAPKVSSTEAGDTIRWDIVTVVGTNVNPGGQATALAQDGSKITMTGFGTFRVDDLSNNVTGGGTWETRDSAGIVTGTGTYTVLRTLRFELAPGAFFPPPFVDNVGNSNDARAGLAFLRIIYSDGSAGVLVISCHLVGTPDSVFEGITASKGFVDFWRHETGTTLFHVANP
jgi:hypothetical protein